MKQSTEELLAYIAMLIIMIPVYSTFMKAEYVWCILFSALLIVLIVFVNTWQNK